MLDTILRRLDRKERPSPQEIAIEIKPQGSFMDRMIQGSTRYAVTPGKSACLKDLRLELNGPGLPRCQLPYRLVVSCRRGEPARFAGALHRTDGATPALELTRLVNERLAEVMAQGRTAWISACTQGLDSYSVLADCGVRIGADLTVEFELGQLANGGILQLNAFHTDVPTKDSPISQRVTTVLTMALLPGHQLFAQMLPEPFADRIAIDIAKQTLRQVFVSEIATDALVTPYEVNTPNTLRPSETVFAAAERALNIAFAPYHRHVVALELMPETRLPPGGKQARVQLAFGWQEGSNPKRQLDLDIECQVELASYRLYGSEDCPELHKWLDAKIRQVLDTALRDVTRADFLLKTQEKQQALQQRLGVLTEAIGWKISVFVSKPRHPVEDLYLAGQSVYIEPAQYELRPSVSGARVRGNLGIHLFGIKVSQNEVIERYLDSPASFQADIRQVVSSALQALLRQIGPDEFYLRFDGGEPDGSNGTLAGAEAVGQTLRARLTKALVEQLRQRLPFIVDVKADLQPDTRALREFLLRFQRYRIEAIIREAPFANVEQENHIVPIDVAVELAGVQPEYWSELMERIDEASDPARDDELLQNLERDVISAMRRTIQHLPYRVVAYGSENRTTRQEANPAEAQQLENALMTAARQVVGENLGIDVRIRRLTRGRTSVEENKLNQIELEQRVKAYQLATSADAAQLKLKNLLEVRQAEYRGTLQQAEDRARDALPLGPEKLSDAESALDIFLLKPDGTKKLPEPDKA